MMSLVYISRSRGLSSQFESDVSIEAEQPDANAWRLILLAAGR